jgi:hypothetical protein
VFDGNAETRPLAAINSGGDGSQAGRKSGTATRRDTPEGTTSGAGKYFAGEQAANGQRANGSPTASCLSGKAESGLSAGGDTAPVSKLEHGVQCETVGQVSGQSEHRDSVTLDCEASRRDASLPTDKAYARRKDPETSKAAASSIGNFADNHCRLIYEAIRQFGPMGKTRIAQKAGIDHVAVGKRLPDLQRCGVAHPTDKTEKSGSGRQERIWALAERK